jgi:molecular chaperone GrpE
MRPEEESQGPVVRDRRRIDPATGQVRDTGEAGPLRGPAPGGPSRPGKHSVSRPGGAPASGTGQDAGGGDAEDRAEAAAAAAAEAAAKLAERTADLQRLQAEYANYRKRVERDRLAVREQALANVLNELVPVLDDIGRAREHDELTGGFKSVSESLEAIAAKLGLTSFGEAGDPFDPMRHDALTHSYSDDVTEPTAVRIFQPGYRVGERIIRPARVAVAEPSPAEAPGRGEAAADEQAEADEAAPTEDVTAAEDAALAEEAAPADKAAAADQEEPGAAPGDTGD